MKVTSLPSLLPAVSVFTIAVTVTEGAFTASNNVGNSNPVFTRCRKALHASNNDEKDEMPSWWIPSDKIESPARRARLVREQENLSRFLQGDELRDLRSDIASFKENMKWAMATDDINRIADLQDAINRAEQKDPEVVYQRALEKIETAGTISNIKKKYDTISKYTKEAEAARQFIPRLNMDGLWVGNFGEHGSELVNVTYAGDTLIATKVTGDKHVPRGEISFKAQLEPRDEENSKPLAPIELTGSAAAKWGVDKLSRYPGEGQVASEGFKNNKYVDGQLIMFENYFSFLWVPTKHHVFFSRPSPELTLHMMRDIISEEDEVDNMRQHIGRCFEKDISAAFSRPLEQEIPEPFRRIQREVDLITAMEEKEGDEESKSPISPISNKFSFWAIKKWKDYIDETLKDDKNGGLNGFNPL